MDGPFTLQILSVHGHEDHEEKFRGSSWESKLQGWRRKCLYIQPGQPQIYSSKAKASPSANSRVLKGRSKGLSRSYLDLSVSVMVEQRANRPTDPKGERERGKGREMGAGTYAC